MSYTCELNNIGDIIAKSGKTKEVAMCEGKFFLSSQKYDIENISIIKSNMRTNDDVRVNFKDLNYKYFSIGCIFEGGMNFRYKDTKKTLYHDKKSSILSSPNTLSGYTLYEKDKNISGLEISLTDNFLKQNAPFLLEKTYKQKQIPKNQKMQTLAYEIYNSPFTGDLEKLYLQSKVYEFVYLNFLALNEKKQKPKIIFSEFDKEALKKAKEILENSFDITPTIPELSRLVSLNEYKLKYGFKYFFNQTPHKILLSSRLTKAKEMLLSGEYNVSEVAQKVGFKYAPTFSKAFVKVHGVLPKDVRKRADIYI